MENRRSSTIQQSRKLSLVQQDNSSSLIKTVRLNDQKDISVNNFVQSCPYRIQDIDHNTIIK
jgi:hypothetical protein